MEGIGLNNLANTSIVPDCSNMGDFLGSSDMITPSPVVLREILAKADFYNFQFFTRFMKEVLYELASLGKLYALSAATIAIELKDLRLTQYAVKRMAGLPGPSSFDLRTVKAIGLEVWWHLVTAFQKGMRDSYGITEEDGIVITCKDTAIPWKSIGDAMVLH
jgi:hypothetical protein